MLNEILVSAGAGVAAGLGVAMPLGAIAALLLREGLVNGLRVATAAAAGVATVDLVYCVAAMIAGAAIAPAVESQRAAFLGIAGLLIVAMGVRQLATLRPTRSAVIPDLAQTSALSSFLRFVGLTAVNPLTLVYFLALAGAVTTRSGSWVGPVLFVTAVGASSLAWQVMLASIGTVFRRSFNARTAHAVGVAASVLIIGLGCSVAVSGLVAPGS
jgi:threonine/homoserine/homoserine lactone efflux protein